MMGLPGRRFVVVALATLVAGGCGPSEKGAEKAFDRGVALADEGERVAARQQWERALRDGEKVGAHSVVARARGRLGGLLLEAGDFAGAALEFQAGIEATRQTENRLELGNLLNNAGLAYRSMGDLDKAESHYLEAVAENDRINNALGEAAALNNLGAIARVRGDVDSARDLYLRALGVARRGEEPLAIGRSFLSIGDLEKEHGLPDDAMSAFDQALEAFDQISDDVPEIGYANLRKGNILEELGALREAKRLYLLAHAQYRRLDDRPGQASAAAALGNISLQLGDTEDASALLEEALSLMAGFGTPADLSDLLVKVALARRLLGNPGGAVQAYGQAMDLRVRMGDTAGVAMINMNLGALFEQEGDLTNAGLAFRQAHEQLIARGDTLAAREAERAMLRIKEAGARRHG